MPARRKHPVPSRLLLLAALMLAVSGAVARAAAPKPGPWLGLDGGQMGKYEWSVKVHRPGAVVGAGSQGADRPCIFVSATWRLGRFDYHRSTYRQCAGFPDHLTAREAPLIASAGQPSTGRTPKMTAVGMLVAPAARRVQITFAGGRKMTLALRRLQAGEARRARLAPFRYVAFVVRGAWCAERLLTEGASGRTLWDSGVDEYTCSGGGEPIP